jgi:hypothetical protein
MGKNEDKKVLRRFLGGSQMMLWQDWKQNTRGNRQYRKNVNKENGRYVILHELQNSGKN